MRPRPPRHLGVEARCIFGPLKTKCCSQEVTRQKFRGLSEVIEYFELLLFLTFQGNCEVVLGIRIVVKITTVAWMLQFALEWRGGLAGICGIPVHLLSEELVILDFFVSMLPTAKSL